MNFIPVNNEKTKLNLKQDDYDWLINRLSQLSQIIKDDDFYLIPSADLKTGVIYVEDQHKMNKSSHYSIENDSVSLANSNDSIQDLMKDEYRRNYLSMVQTFTDLCQIRPDFLKNYVNTKNIMFYFSDNLALSTFGIKYFKMRNLNIVDISNMKSVSMRFNLLNILENNESYYKPKILKEMFHEHNKIISEHFTLKDFLETPEDIFLQLKMMNY